MATREGGVMTPEQGLSETFRERFPELMIPSRRVMRKVADIMAEIVEDHHIKCDHPEIPRRPKQITDVDRKMREKDISAERLFEEMYDLVGVRVICFFLDEVYKVVNEIRRHSALAVIEPIDDYIKTPTELGYRSMHINVWCSATHKRQQVERPCEIQVRTAFQHAFASKIHDPIYKREQAGERIKPSLKAQLAIMSNVVHAADEMMILLLGRPWPYVNVQPLGQTPEEDDR